MKKFFKVDRNTLLFSLRYSLGRESAAPSIIIDNIKHNIDLLDADDLHLFIKEISDCSNYGMNFDKTNWENFSEYLKAELKKREK